MRKVNHNGTESAMDFFNSLSTKSPSKGRVTKNVLRPVYANGSDVESGKLSAASSAWSGISGTKGQHLSNLATLQRVAKDDQTTGKTFKKVKSKLGKMVRVGVTVVVRAKDIEEVKEVKFKGIKVKPIGTMKKILESV